MRSPATPIVRVIRPTVTSSAACARRSPSAQGRGGNRLPLWQFTTEGVLPHLRRVLTALPPNLHPLEVQAFFMVPAAEFTSGTVPMCLRDWLAAGGAPAGVVELAAALGGAP